MASTRPTAAAATSTVDPGAPQQIVEEELESACRQFKPKMAVAIMMRPKTGEILAIANRPTFDPNTPGDFAPEAMKNRAIADMIEPGSIFKIVPVSAALNEKLVTPDTMIFCENAHFLYGGRTLHDHRAYGDESVENIWSNQSTSALQNSR